MEFHFGISRVKISLSYTSLLTVRPIHTIGTPERNGDSQTVLRFHHRFGTTDIKVLQQDRRRSSLSSLKKDSPFAAPLVVSFTTVVVVPLGVPHAIPSPWPSHSWRKFTPIHVGRPFFQLLQRFATFYGR